MGVVVKTKKLVPDDRPLKGDRSFRSRSAGQIGPLLPFSVFSVSLLLLQRVPCFDEISAEIPTSIP